MGQYLDISKTSPEEATGEVLSELAVTAAISRLGRNVDVLGDQIRKLNDRLTGQVATQKEKNSKVDKERGIETVKSDMIVVGTVNNITDLVRMLQQEVTSLHQRLQV